MDDVELNTAKTRTSVRGEVEGDVVKGTLRGKVEFF